ncbi:MAG: enoyl-CoA hydratase-related protein, partial [Thermodesulfobacteriota bacterium]|nr:enoyl-CoA hydratase-related protein [Thermodesulfobacteriota bacterium]
CDYRIITDNTVFQNPNLELEMVPKGGGVFFLSKMVGPVKASKILLSGEDITAAEALELGIVDKVVPVKKLGETAIKVAQTYAEKPATYLSGIKRLLNYDIKTLEGCLECENELLRRAIRSLAFKKMEIFHGAT